MPTPAPSPRDSLSRRITAALCVAMLVAFACGLHRVTAGFEAWTFEGLRREQLRSGSLRAVDVPLLGLPGRVPKLWQPHAAEPAAYLVDFVYTRCPSVCVALGSEYQQMQREMNAADATRSGIPAGHSGVHLVSISFDLEHDDPAALAQHAARLGADPQVWTWVVPATSADSARLRQSLGVVTIADGQGGFVHNGAIHLLDERGRLRGLFEFDEWPQALAAAKQLVVQPRSTP